MRKTSFILLFLMCFLSNIGARAQSYYTMTEYGLAFGCSQYFGDLNNNYGFKTINMAYGVYLRYHLNQFISVKLVTNYTHIGYDDKYNSNPFEKERNLNFQTDIYEAVLQAEFNFFRFATGDPEHRYTPYLTGGIGGFLYDPYTIYNGTVYHLRPLGTEGQKIGYNDRQYDVASMCFPIGAGFKMWLLGGVNLNIEIADRIVTTSYLDDVSATYVGINSFKANSIASKLQDRSIEVNDPNTPALGRPGKQRGTTSRQDNYLMMMMSLSWHFKSYKCPQYLNDDMIRVRRRG